MMRLWQEIKSFIVRIFNKFCAYFSLKQDNQFFAVFVDMANALSCSCDSLVSLVSNNSQKKSSTINAQIKSYHQRIAELHSGVLSALNICFISPIDRGDIQSLSVLCLKLSKKIMRISYKIKIYGVAGDSDNSLVGGVVLLQNVTKMILEMVKSLQQKKYAQLSYNDDYMYYFDDNELDDFRYSISNIHKDYEVDFIHILCIREVYMVLESAVDTARAILELIMQIAIKLG